MIQMKSAEISRRLKSRNDLGPAKSIRTASSLHFGCFSLAMFRSFLLSCLKIVSDISGLTLIESSSSKRYG